MSAEVVAFPGKLQAFEAANSQEIEGPPVGSLAWGCLPCHAETGEKQFAFYCTSEGVHCWRCHTIQFFS